MTRQLGEHAGHGELVAWSFEIAAWYALVEGRFPHVVELREAGLGHAGAGNATVQLTLQASPAYARMGDKRATETLAAGKAILERLPVPDHPEHHFVFDRYKYEFCTATIYTWLGTDDRAAEENAREVVARCLGSGGVIRWPTRLSTTLVNLGQIALSTWARSPGAAGTWTRRSARAHRPCNAGAAQPNCCLARPNSNNACPPGTAASR